MAACESMDTKGNLNHSRSQDDDDLPAFSIPLDEVVTSSTNVHAQNDPKNPWQRETFSESNNGRVAFSCVCKDVVHGFYAEPEGHTRKELRGRSHVDDGDDDDDDDEEEDEEEEEEEEDEEEEEGGSDDDDRLPQACTLIVLHFRFDPVDLGRRIKKVQAAVRFSAMDEAEDDPVVDKISPDGFFWVYPTTQKETVTVGALGKAGAPLPGVEVGGELKRDKTVEKEVTNAGTVRGAMETVGRVFGKPNTATWTLMENPADKTGTPVSLRASILVKRDPGVNFRAHFSMTVTPDNLTRAQTWFKSRVTDAPILFKVDKKPTNKLHKYTIETLDEDKKLKLVNNLGKLDLDSPEFTDMTFRTVWKTAEK
ncbi:hypothetical protein B0I37DRAFT_64876 [Chaetomium sp. MPI-CAGE-AT-0009]|nr:hypothetical protein B0I37DRAFT_64876 [Chaetomium sp. MPI-CAGE-AT-0009]